MTTIRATRRSSYRSNNSHRIIDHVVLLERVEEEELRDEVVVDQGLHRIMIMIMIIDRVEVEVVVDQEAVEVEVEEGAVAGATTTVVRELSDLIHM